MKPYSAITQHFFAYTMLALLCSPNAFSHEKSPQSFHEPIADREAKLAEIRKSREEVALKYAEARERLLHLWLQRTQESINARWRWPEGADRMPACAATVSFSTDGHVESVAFESPCASKELQTPIEVAIRTAMPRLPDDIVANNRAVIHFQARSPNP